MSAAATAIIPGEAELGHQRHCSGCGEWWPADREFWYFFLRSRRGGIVEQPSHICRACWDARKRGRS